MKNNSTRRNLLLACALGLASSLSFAAWPDGKTVKILVPWPAGGATDQIGRMLAEPLGKALGVPVIVDNKGGAGGVIGTQLFVREKDPHTILLATSSTAMIPAPVEKTVAFSQKVRCVLLMDANRTKNRSRCHPNPNPRGIFPSCPLDEWFFPWHHAPP